MNTDISKDKERVTIILHSGAYDRASYALTLALITLASEMEVHMLLTFEGLRRFTKGHLGDIGEETSADMQASINLGLETGAVQPLETQLAQARKLGLKIYACPNAMAALNIGLRDLVDEIDDVLGLATFLEFVRSAKINWYI